MNIDNHHSIARAIRPTLSLSLAFLAVLLTHGGAAAQNRSGWSLNFTPAVMFPRNEDRFGGGVDPELKYTLDLGGARLSAGGRIGAYYAKNVFGMTVMPTLRLTVPVGPVEPYASVGMGYGWIPKNGHDDFATMSRIGVVFRFSRSIAIGLEGTFQRIDGSTFRFPSLGSMLSLDL